MIHSLARAKGTFRPPLHHQPYSKHRQMCNNTNQRPYILFHRLFSCCILHCTFSSKLTFHATPIIAYWNEKPKRRIQTESGAPAPERNQSEPKAVAQSVAAMTKATRALAKENSFNTQNCKPPRFDRASITDCRGPPGSPPHPL